MNFAWILHYAKVKNSELENYKIIKENNSNEDNDELTLEKEEGMSLTYVTHRAYKNCAIYCYKILHRFNVLTNSINLFGLELTFLMTLSLSQVTCEKSFVYI